MIEMFSPSIKMRPQVRLADADKCHGDLPAPDDSIYLLSRDGERETLGHGRRAVLVTDQDVGVLQDALKGDHVVFDHTTFGANEITSHGAQVRESGGDTRDTTRSRHQPMIYLYHKSIKVSTYYLPHDAAAQVDGSKILRHFAVDLVLPKGRMTLTRASVCVKWLSTGSLP